MVKLANKPLQSSWFKTTRSLFFFGLPALGFVEFFRAGTHDSRATDTSLFFCICQIFIVIKNGLRLFVLWYIPRYKYFARVTSHWMSLVFAERHFVKLTHFLLPAVFFRHNWPCFLCSKKFVSFKKTIVR